jgi:hypothetical protein
MVQTDIPLMHQLMDLFHKELLGMLLDPLHHGLDIFI